MNRFPWLAAIVVAIAVAAMIGLGVWQLQRAEWKSELLVRYRAAASLPALGRIAGQAPDQLYFRRAVVTCAEDQEWTRTHGRNARGEPGWSHRLDCRTVNGDDVHIDMGWSRTTLSAVGWRQGPVAGTLVPDRRHGVRLIAATPSLGLEPSQLPSPEDIPDNHRLYAFQWFFFGLAAAVIFALALRRRLRAGREGPTPPAP